VAFANEISPNYSETKRTLPRPRHFKTHFSVPFLPDQIWKKKPKVRKDSVDNLFIDESLSDYPHFEEPKGRRPVALSFLRQL
jgi:hypothetical protein